MIKCRTYFPWLMLLFAVAAVCAVAEPTPEELEEQHRKLEAWRKQPEHLARLRQDLKFFQELPPERQEQLRKLDEQLHQESAAKQARLWQVMDRYVDWLERLPEKDRQAIKHARDKTTRLALVRDLREQEWMRGQPKALREQWAALDANERTLFVKQLRDTERQRHQEWLLAGRFWDDLHDQRKTMPARLSDFSDRVQKYVNDYLMLMLSEAEKEQLVRAEGRWPDYPKTLVEIARKHPSALPPRDKDLPDRLDQLPMPIQKEITIDKKGDKLSPDKKVVPAKRAILPKLQPFEKTPNFASKVVEFATIKGKKPFENEFWACNFKSLQPPMQAFVKDRLTPSLKDFADKKELLDMEGSWPYYPLTIQKLSQKYNLSPPWHILPEPERWKWDSYRFSKQGSSRNPDGEKR